MLIDEPQMKEERVIIVAETVCEREGNGTLHSVQEAEISHQTTADNVQEELQACLPIDPTGMEKGNEEGEEGEEGQCAQGMGSRSNSFPSGVFRPQSAAYLIAQREACQGSLETSMSGDDRDKGKVAFSPGPSPLKSTLSKSPVIGVGIPQQSQYYLGESDSFADFHPRKGGFAHHPFTPVLKASNTDVKQALEDKDESDLSPMETPGPMERKDGIIVFESVINTGGNAAVSAIEDEAIAVAVAGRGEVAEGGGESASEAVIGEKEVPRAGLGGGNAVKGTGIVTGTATGAVTGAVTGADALSGVEAEASAVSTKAFSSDSSSSSAALLKERRPSSSRSLVDASVFDQCQLLEGKDSKTTIDASAHSAGTHTASQSRSASRSGSVSGRRSRAGSEGHIPQVAVIHADEETREIDNVLVARSDNGLADQGDDQRNDQRNEQGDATVGVVDNYDDDDFIDE